MLSGARLAPCYGMSRPTTPILQTPLPQCHRNSAARRSAKGRLTMTKIWTAFVCAATLTMDPAMAEATVPLAQEAHINEQLIAAAAGDILRKTCPTLEARTFVVLAKLADLKSYTRAQGYTEDEVKVFLKDKAQKARIKASATDYLTAAGAVTGNAESFCTAGRNEIAKGTLTGSLLRSTQ